MIWCMQSSDVSDLSNVDAAPPIACPARSSYFDSEKSEEEASRLPYNEDLGSTEGLDPLELEMTELPRSTKVKTRGGKQRGTGGGGGAWR